MEPTVIYEVVCWSVDGKLLRVEPDSGQLWFSSQEEAQEVADGVLDDQKRPDGIAAVCVYEAKPKTVKYAP